MAINNDYESMVFAVENSGSKEELWNDVSKFLQLAQTQQNICVVRTEIPDTIVVVDYQHDEDIEGWGCHNPRWISNEEWENVLSERDLKNEKVRCNKNYEEV